MRLRASSCRKIFLALAVLMAVCPSQATAAAWKFGVMGDTQWSGTDSTGNNLNTVAVNQINACNTRFINAGVDFVVQVGDLCDQEGTNNAGLSRRLTANSALTTAGIEFYGLRGNHESSSSAQTYFNTNYIPTSTADRPVVVNSSDTSSYSVTVNNTKIVLLDYSSTSGTTSKLDSATTWMGTQLSAADHEQAFVFQHKNLLGQNHKDNMFGSSNDANTTQQNNFISTLQSNGIRYDISGHDHMHYRSNVTSPDGNSSVQELICASDSYKYYTPQSPYSTRDNSISQQLGETGYYIFTVDGPRVTAQYYHTTPLANGDVSSNPTWKLGETFGYSTNGKEFLVESNENFSAVTDTFGDTTMSLNGVNASTVATSDGRTVAKDVNTGWTAKNAGQLSDTLTLWGLEDIDSATTASAITLTMSYDADYTGDLSKLYVAHEGFDGKRTALAGTFNAANHTFSTTISSGGMFTVVPEPSTIVLLMTGTAMFLFALRKRRSVQ